MRAHYFLAAAAVVGGLVLSACSNDKKETATESLADKVLSACQEVGGTLSLLQGDEWTCDQVPVASDNEYQQLTDHFDEFCDAPNIYSSGWLDADNTVAGWSCWRLKPGAAATLEDACSMLSGTLETAGDIWVCDNIPLVTIDRYSEVEAILAPFCAAPSSLTSGLSSEDPPVAGWSCSPAEPTGSSPSADSLDGLCAQLGGQLSGAEGQSWTCDEVPLASDADVAPVADQLMVFCPAPQEFTYGLRSESPLVVGFSCN